MPSSNYFDLFGLEAKFQIDLSALETKYRAVQSASHPDRFVNATPAEKVVAMQAATSANEAYQRLKQPTLRAAYLVELNGINLSTESSQTMPADFLMQQMEWREAVEDNVNNLSGLHHLLKTVKQEGLHLQQQLTELIDHQKNWQQGANTVRKLQFIDKLREEINRKIEVLED